MPAPFPPNDTAIVRFRYTKAQPAGKPQPVPAGSPPGTLPVQRPEIAAGTEDVEVFKLDPPARDIAEVERQWREANQKSDKDWQDARFPDPAATPPAPAALKPEPDVDAQGVRHRAAGETDLPGTVTETADALPPKSTHKRVTGTGTRADTDEETMIAGNPLSFYDGKGETVEELQQRNDGVGEARAHEIIAARRKRDRAANK